MERDSKLSVEERVQLLEEKNQQLRSRIRVLSEENRDQASLIAALMEKTPFGIVLLDSKRRVLQMNRAAEMILNTNRVRAVGNECTRLFNCYHQNDQCPVMARGQQLDRVETPCAAAGSGDKTLLRSMWVAQHKGEEVLLEAFVDISEIKKAQHIKEQALKAKDDFLAKMSHELRTPLNAIIGFSELLQDELSERGQNDFREDLVNITTAGKDLLHLVDEVLDIHKIQTNKITLELECIDVESFLSEIEQSVIPLVLKNNNTLSLHYPRGKAEVYADRLRLKQVLLNLISNACKFTDNGQITITVYVEVRTAVRYTCFVIEDTGIGMTPEQMLTIFNEFEQVDNSATRQFEGAGLGLSIAKQFAEMMNGELTVSSAAGQGSVFTLTVPTSRDSESATI